MPTKSKIEKVELLSRLIQESTIIISANFSGMSVDMMTELRRSLREQGIEFKVVKNTLTYLAADDAGNPMVKNLVEGQTAIAFGFSDPTQPAKTLTEFIVANKAPLKIMAGVMGDRALTAAEINELAILPGKDDLIALLLGQLEAPISHLLNILASQPLALARVLQRHVESVGVQDQKDTGET